LKRGDKEKIYYLIILEYEDKKDALLIDNTSFVSFFLLNKRNRTYFN
jgi:tRNA A22 N-methylase